MKLNKIIVPATLALLTLAPLAANADSLQDRKNTDRNIAIGAGAIGLYGLLNHNSTATVLGLAGAAIAGSQYEQARHQQSVDNDWGGYYYRNQNQNEYRYNHGDRDDHRNWGDRRGDRY